MLRWLLALLFLFSLVGITGCFTRDVAHNRYHLNRYHQQLQELHEDIDFTIMY